ncbi:MAG: cell division topological specificity factor MinE [bacterium]|nr:cell division topological specificity factor MinE [bacterium]
MQGFWARLFGRTPEPEPRGSSSVAKERLQFILIHDRVRLPPERMDAMKQEILAVLRKYIDVEGDNVEIALQKRDHNSMLIAEVPFIKPVAAPAPDDQDDA